jgi:hypothetical protein
VRKSDKSVKQTLEENWIQECARITVPLDWLRPTSYKNITLFIRRFHPNQTAPLNQLWLLDGGPGGDGSGLGPLIGIPIAQMMKTPLTVYVPSHRGTGLSSCLGTYNGPFYNILLSKPTIKQARQNLFHIQDVISVLV